MHNRQALLKKSIEFMRDRPTGWAAGGMPVASAQAKISQDPEIQGVMELLSRARMLGHENKRGRGLGLSVGPVTGPAISSGDNIFERDFIQHPTTNEDESAIVSPTDQRGRRLSANRSGPGSPMFSLEHSPEPSKTQEEPSFTGHTISPPPRGTLKRTYTDVSAVSLQNKLTEALAQPYLADEPSILSRSLITSPPLGPSSITGFPGFLPHAHGRAAPTSQAIFTTQAEYPWTITQANDLACLIFGVTKAELRSTLR